MKNDTGIEVTASVFVRVQSGSGSEIVFTTGDVDELERVRCWAVMAVVSRNVASRFSRSILIGGLGALSRAGHKGRSQLSSDGNEARFETSIARLLET